MELFKKLKTLEIKTISQKATYWLSVSIVGLVVGLGIQVASAGWNPPTMTPPNQNIYGPVTTGGYQLKMGGLGLQGSLTTLGDVVAAGKVDASKILIAKKWLLSDTNPAGTADEWQWLRLFNKDGSGYYGGFAAERLWAQSDAYFNNGNATFFWGENEGEVLKLNSTKDSDNKVTSVFLQNYKGTFRLVNNSWTADLFKVEQNGNATVTGNLSANNLYVNGINATGGVNAGWQVKSPQYCIGDSCITAWPTGGGGGGEQNITGGMYMLGGCDGGTLSDSKCRFKNPKTGACSCPYGYNGHQVWDFNSQGGSPYYKDGCNVNNEVTASMWQCIK